MKPPSRLALVGATGQIGSALLEQLAELEASLGSVTLLASAASAGRRLEFGGHYQTVVELADFDFKQVDLVLFATPAAVSQQYVPLAVAAGCQVIDMSGQFLADMSVPLICPGVTLPRPAPTGQGSLHALPGVIALQLAGVIAPAIADDLLVSLDVVAMLAASVAGQAGVDELAAQTAALLNAREPQTRVFPEQLAFQLQLAGAQAQGSSHAVLAQGAVLTLKRLFDLHLQVTCQAFFAPLFHGSSLAVTLSCNDAVDAGRAESWLEQAGVTVLDEGTDGQARGLLPDAGSCELYGAINGGAARQPERVPFWLAADNVTYCANMAVQSLQLLLKVDL